MNNKKRGMGFLSVLGLIFIVLKLTNLVTWSWWVVLLPIYGPMAFILILLFILWKIS